MMGGLAPKIWLAAAVVQQLSTPVGMSVSEQALVQQIEQSGRCVTVGEAPEQEAGGGLRIAPGQPPILSFKYYEDARHHRFGNVDVMLDDAGH